MEKVIDDNSNGARELKILREENVRLKADLEEKSLKIREFSDMLPQLIFETDMEGKITFINEFGLRLLGYSREEMLMVGDVFSLVDPTSKEAVIEGFQNTLNGAGPAPREYKVIRKDGKTLPILLHGVLYKEHGIPKGIRGTGIDVSELREAEEKLSIERILLRALIDNLPDRIYAKDTSSRFIICNDALVRRMGKNSAEEVIGKTDLDLTNREDALEYFADEQKIINTGISLLNKEEALRFISGEQRWSLSSKIPLRNSRGEIIGIVGIGRDITDLKIAQMEAEDKNEQLRKIIADRDKFFSIIAHDLKSPFNYFLGFTELLSDEIESMSKERIKGIASNMRKSAVNLYSLLENLLEWAKMQRGLIEFKPQEFSLFDKIRTCVDTISGPAVKKEIKITLEIPKKLFVIADNHMFDAIIRNLVSNAIKFSNKGSKIVISGIALNEGLTEVTVSDSGIGMNAGLISDLFIRNDKTRRKGTDNEPSTGLGLMLCKEFVEKHDGKMWVTSKEGEGSIFGFTVSGFIKS